MGSSDNNTKSATESFTARWLRRAITIPTIFVLTTLFSFFVPVILPLSCVVDIVSRRNFGISRTIVFLLIFLWCETIGIFTALFLWIKYIGRSSDEHHESFVRDNSWLQAIWVHTIFSSARFLFKMHMTVEGSVPVPGKRPLLVFVRHASTIDTGLPIVLLSYPLRYQLRYVLKRELLFDPCVDIVGQRIPNRFVRRGDRTVDEIERVVGLYENLKAHDAIVIFPEGTRFSDRKRRNLVQQLRARGPSPALELAESLQHTLSPLRKGALALLEKNPGCDLVVVAHRGLERATSFAAFMRGNLVETHVGVRISHIPFEELPADVEGQGQLLAKLWHDVDRFAGGEKQYDRENASRHHTTP